ncbi:hypothetical protein WA026_010132 [Henosepilachna vigintioctopunctata]|uniref:Hexosyltransferase n=1 Tax=Henosepilachna vigintioctopunctata TaxID=420089 RepID=A0AAW1U919_9CUCU
MQVIFYHNQSGFSAFTGNLKQKEIHQAITLHPVKHPEHLYRLHNYFKSLKIQSNRHDALKLQRDLVFSWNAIGHQIPQNNKMSSKSSFSNEKESYLNSLDYMGVPASITTYPAGSLENVHEWDFISGSLYSTGDLNPKRRIGSSSKEGLADTVAEVMELINFYSKQRGRIIEFKEVMYSYFRLNPLHGVEYILDLLLVYRKYRGHKMTIHVRRHAYIQQLFSALYIRDTSADPSKIEEYPADFDKKSLPVHKQIKHALINLQRNLQPFFEFNESNEKEAIYFILPLSGRFETFERFMKTYERVCLIPREHTSLIIILYENPDSTSDLDNTMNLVEFLQNKYYDNKISIIHKNEQFSRGKALNYGVENLKDNDLIFFVDVDMMFNDETLKRIRMNTILNKSVYFPIVFSSYNLKMFNKSSPSGQQLLDSTYVINEDSGFWRQFGFGIVSLYKSDYLEIGGFNLMITGWGFEDVTFYDKVVKSNLEIVRSVDPSLVHIYHVIHCDDNLDVTQKNMCLGSEASVLGSLKNLQKIYENHKDLFKETSIT